MTGSAGVFNYNDKDILVKASMSLLALGVIKEASGFFCATASFVDFGDYSL